MPTTLTEVAKFLFEHEFRFKTIEEDQSIFFGIGTKNYENKNGDRNLGVVIRLEEDGRYIKILCPQAFAVDKKHASVAAEVCVMVQWKTKLIQFEYDAEDGEIRPIIEFPLEDARLTGRQLMRCVNGLAQIVDNYYLPIIRAIKEGVVEFERTDEASRLATLLDALPADVLEQLLRKKRGEL